MSTAFFEFPFAKGAKAGRISRRGDCPPQTACKRGPHTEGKRFHQRKEVPPAARGISATGGDGRARPRAAGRWNPPSRRKDGRPHHLFSAAQPPRRYRTPRRKCGVRRREPVGRATGVYSIKRGPPCAARSGEQRDGAAWRYQRKIAGAQKLFCLPEAEMRPGLPQSLPGSALTQPKSPVPKEGAYGGTWFHSPPRCARRGPQWDGLWSLHSWSSRRLARRWPRWQIARGPRCGAALHFRRNAAIGGPGGRPHLPEWHSSSVPPGAFSLGPLQRPVLFVPHCARRSGDPF